MGGFVSTGMVVCASNEAHDDVKCLEPPPGAPVGSLVAFAGVPAEPASASQVAE
jgi:tRNA-binding EMAP/Myf-like protein